MFSGTELAFSKRVVDAVTDGLAGRRPSASASSTCLRRWSTSTPNIFADMIEWMHRHLARRDVDRAVGASAQRPRHRHRGGRVRADGRRRSHRGLPVRQRRAHRQRRPRQHRAQPLHAGRVAGARLLRHRRGAALRRALQPVAGAPAPSVRRRPGLHLVLRARTRTRSRRPLPRGATATSGTCLTCRSTRWIWAAATTP